MRSFLVFLVFVEGYAAWFDQIHIATFSPRDLIFGTESKESFDVEALVAQHYLEEGFLVFDVGANAGQWSSMALYFHPSLRIIAFEPIPEKILGFEKKKLVEMHRIALADRQGKSLFYYVSDASVLSSLYDRSCFSMNKVEAIEVDVETLDGFCGSRGIDRIDYLKIDTEGAELAILKGAEELFNRKAVAALQFEYGGCYRDSKTTLKEMMQLLTDAGFVLFRMVPSGLMHIASWHPALENYGHTNFFAILKEEAAGYDLVKMRRAAQKIGPAG